MKGHETPVQELQRDALHLEDNARNHEWHAIEHCCRVEYWL